MKKKLAAMICAAVLVLALPMSAFAASPSQKTVVVPSTPAGTSATVTGATDLMSGVLVVENSTQQASNTEGTPVLTLHITRTDGETSLDDYGNIVVTFNVGAENAGKTATIYIQHELGNTETATRTVGSDGTFTLAVSELSYYSVVLSENQGGQGGQGHHGDKGSATSTTTTTDTSSTSPKTGVDFAGAAAVATIALAGAGVAFAARRKMNE